MIDLHVRHHFSQNDQAVYAKEMALPKGCCALSHRHTYDHLGVLWHGAALVEVGGKECLYQAPAFIMIKADAEHKITAIEDVLWFCVHETDETDPEKIDSILIKES